MKIDVDILPAIAAEWKQMTAPTQEKTLYKSINRKYEVNHLFWTNVIIVHINVPLGFVRTNGCTVQQHCPTSVVPTPSLKEASGGFNLFWNYCVLSSEDR